MGAPSLLYCWHTDKQNSNTINNVQLTLYYVIILIIIILMRETKPGTKARTSKLRTHRPLLICLLACSVHLYALYTSRHVLHTHCVYSIHIMAAFLFTAWLKRVIRFAKFSVFQLIKMIIIMYSH